MIKFSDICDWCGKEFGQHYFHNNACPVIGGFHPTHSFVKQSVVAKTYPQTLFSAQCAVCGESFGNHHNGNNACPISFTKHGITYSDRYFFVLVDPDFKRGSEDSCKKDCKPPSRECPCGIVRADCDYHK